MDDQKGPPTLAHILEASLGVLNDERRQYDELCRVAAALVRDIELLAPVFHFVVPANASKVKALLAGKRADQWQEMRDPNEPTQVY